MKKLWFKRKTKKICRLSDHQSIALLKFDFKKKKKNEALRKLIILTGHFTVFLTTFFLNSLQEDREEKNAKNNSRIHKGTLLIKQTVEIYCRKTSAFAIPYSIFKFQQCLLV